MSIKIITYDLQIDETRESYQLIYDYLKTNNAMRLSESCYAIDSELTVSQIYDILTPAIDENDLLLVLAVEALPSGQHYEDVFQWMLLRTARIDGDAVATLMKPIPRPSQDEKRPFFGSLMSLGN